MFLLDRYHVEIGKNVPPKRVAGLLILDAWFLKIILLDCDFFCSSYY